MSTDRPEAQPFRAPVTAEPTGSLDGDLAAVVVAGGEYKQVELSVR